MLEEVESRKHRVVKVFPANFDAIVQMHAAEFMLFGSVAYRKTGPDSEVTVDWAAHAKLKRDGVNSPWRFEYYRVYLQR